MLLKTIQICLVLIAIAIWLPPSLVAHTKTEQLSKKTPLVTVPFVGCKADGQVGPIAAPKGPGTVVQLAAVAAQRLAYYKAENCPGVLAPRGWHGFETYGSNGSSLFVTPQPIKRDDLFSEHFVGFTGPCIQVSRIYGSTSGRFEVARIIARVFPKQMEFVRSVIKEKIEPAGDFPSGPYRKDHLTYRNENIVEYHTPPQSEGLGTQQSRLRQNRDPIDGAVILQDPASDDVSLVAVRLPADSIDLKSTIIQQFEQENSSRSASTSASSSASKH